MQVSNSSTGQSPRWFEWLLGLALWCALHTPPQMTAVLLHLMLMLTGSFFSLYLVTLLL